MNLIDIYTDGLKFFKRTLMKMIGVFPGSQGSTKYNNLSQKDKEEIR
jgi:hypothetical protein